MVSDEYFREPSGRQGILDTLTAFSAEAQGRYAHVDYAAIRPSWLPEAAATMGTALMLRIGCLARQAQHACGPAPYASPVIFVADVVPAHPTGF